MIPAVVEYGTKDIIVSIVLRSHSDPSLLSAASLQAGSGMSVSKMCPLPDDS